MNGPQNNDLKRQFLMKRLLDAVKQCQIRFGGRKEIASDSDSRVICLCAQFEAVLQHGLKRSRGLTLTAAAIKQAAGFASKTETDPMFWVYVKEILNKHELQRFYSLKTITTDIGRGRAWLRCALNEHSLERYLHMLLGDTNRLSFFYEDWSFLFDEERSSMLPTMAADGKAKKERKKKKKVLTIISFDDDGDMEDPDLVNVSKTLMSSIESSEKQTDSSSEVLPHFEAQFQLDLHDKENDDSSCVTEEVDYAKLVVKSIAKEELDDYDAYEPEIVSWSGDRDKSASCEQTPVGSSEHPQVCCWTPLQVLHDNSEVLFPVKAAGSYSHSDSTLDNLPHGHENESATFAKELAQRETDIHFSMEASPPVPGPTLTSILLGIPEPDSMIFRSRQHPNNDSHPSCQQGELRQASVILKNRKDELEEQNISLRNLLDSEMEHSSILRLEIDNLRRKVEEQEERHAAKIQALARENEVLKVQLKKYVCAVQMLKKEGHNDTIPNPRNIDGEIIPEVKPVVDHGELASSYEQKLIEVAEMHGELIEFNERLHRTLLTKEALVLQMRQELIDLRGPVPGDLSQTSEDESLSDFEISHRALVNVWIPSVFLRGKSTHAFHVYQIYIRIKDDEWNIYKRYAEFRSLHHKLLSKYPHVKTFYFPPKKAIGNKDAKFVEERRKQLQVYLRNVMNKVIQTMPDFVAKPNKDRLTDIIPFFASE
ncbi:sorting nexin-29 isoform X3 [Aquarana catesbeiana]|uniref:sorting nexin-29 isoform X3 n=1 Tax=Aquarana catesbeiana TaxID=8400 RepID=UPI003CCA3475